MLRAARPTPFTYRATLALTAVLPLPNRSYEMPRRGLRSFQFATRPTQPCAALLIPSAQVSNDMAGFHVLAGSVSGRVSVMNQSQRMPAVIVARRIVHLSCAKTALSFLIALLRSVGIRSVTLTGLRLPFARRPLYVTAETSLVHCCTRRHRAWLIVAPKRIACAPVTYE